MFNKEYFLEPVDFYCERTDATFWSEPFNAITNIVFIIAAISIYYIFKELKNSDRKTIIIMTSLSAFVGIGSFLFHTFANRMTMVLDILPIALFATTIMYYSFKNVLKWNVKGSLIGAITFFIVLITFQKLAPMDILSGSLMYLPVLLSVIFFGIITNGKIKKYYLLGAMFFLIGVTFRTLDNYLIGHSEIGTHFLWHTFNGFTFFYFMMAVIKAKDYSLETLKNNK